MAKRILTIIFFLILNCSVYSQSQENIVFSPFIDIDDLGDSETIVIKKYNPFDDFTILSPKFGTRVYSEEGLNINMFSFAYSAGNIDNYRPGIDLGLLFRAFKNSQGYDLKNNEIIFLIENERYVKRLEDGIVWFKDHSIFQKLASSNQVRARISIDQKNYEINMSGEARFVVGVLLEEIAYSK